jgi:hypothetical protein
MWTWDIALKIRLYTWLAVENKILTWDNLQKKGWEGPSLCHLCSRDSETVLHLLVNCNFTQQVWQKIKSGLNLKTTWEGNNLITCFDSWLKKEGILALFPPWFVGLFGWKEIRKSLKMVPHLSSRLSFSLWGNWIVNQVLGK